jgi:hypothetical protein
MAPSLDRHYQVEQACTDRPIAPPTEPSRSAAANATGMPEGVSFEQVRVALTRVAGRRARQDRAADRAVAESFFGDSSNGPT